MINPLKRLISNQILGVAIVISAALHFIFFMGFFLQADTQQQSSFGSGKVILLEHVANEPTTATNQTLDTQAASNTSDQAKKSGENGNLTNPVDSAIEKSILIKSPHQQTQKAQNTINKGSLVDQSGKEQEPQEHYRQLVTQHLLKKSKSAPVQGQAIIHLNILKVGIATQVNVELINGSDDYKHWLHRQVLNANPFPSFPSNIKKASLKLAISISHSTEQ